MNRNTSRIALAVTAALVSAAIVAVPEGGASTFETGSASKRPRSEAGLAKKLAARVTGARTPTARYRAILAVMRTLDVGVVTAKGKTVVRGGRPHEFYLYDFEIKAMAAASAAGRPTRQRAWPAA